MLSVKISKVPRAHMKKNIYLDLGGTMWKFLAFEKNIEVKKN